MKTRPPHITQHIGFYIIATIIMGAVFFGMPINNYLQHLEMQAEECKR